MPLLFILLVAIWSTGFITGKFIVGLIDPNVYLAIRFTLAGAIFWLLAIVFKRPFPPRSDWPKHIIAGSLLNAFYLSLAYIALAQGLPAGVMALIGSMQPILVTLLALVLIKEKTSLFGVLGMLIAIAGLLLVISPSLQHSETTESFSVWLAIIGLGGVISLALGSIYQKMSISGSDIIASMALQNLSAAVISGGFMLALQESLFVHNLTAYALVAWGVIVLSCGGVFLLVWLLRKIPASQVSTLMLLVPPLAAIEGYFLFDEALSRLQLMGVVTTLVGVYLSRVKWGSGKQPAPADEDGAEQQG
ncbi:putative DMT superfamily transporter inner membrane protein [Marinomonas aquimarina]|uniref:Putative DMT superfamily transporter inner membrane protein n=1 Tax=Marinomonas aquimarina TaxID=295068 RepID=A0A1A8TD48_9GAMM|nr:DMT family transporter [Marinomonas aquimarina]SBS29641.1 putative DMT superfamily transporter inner membrane protein [Marinomonas aquimarina]